MKMIVLIFFSPILTGVPVFERTKKYLTSNILLGFCACSINLYKTSFESSFIILYRKNNFKKLNRFLGAWWPNFCVTKNRKNTKFQKNSNIIWRKKKLEKYIFYVLILIYKVFNTFYSKFEIKMIILYILFEIFKILLVIVSMYE